MRKHPLSPRIVAPILRGREQTGSRNERGINGVRRMRQIDRQAGFATLLSTLATASPAVGRTAAPGGRGALWLTGRRLRHGLDTLRLWRERPPRRQEPRAVAEQLLRDIGITPPQAEAEGH